MSNGQLPEVISSYQRAHDARDVATALAAFAPDATVVDDGHTYAGTERIRWWLEHAASEFTYTRTLVSVEDLGDDEHLVRNHLTGDFPGGEADLAYRFRVRDGLITHLRIAP